MLQILSCDQLLAVVLSVVVCVVVLPVAEGSVDVLLQPTKVRTSAAAAIKVRDFLNISISPIRFRCISTVPL